MREEELPMVWGLYAGAGIRAGVSESGILFLSFSLFPWEVDVGKGGGSFAVAVAVAVDGVPDLAC